MLMQIRRVSVQIRSEASFEGISELAASKLTLLGSNHTGVYVNRNEFFNGVDKQGRFTLRIVPTRTVFKGKLWWCNVLSSHS